MNLVVKQSVDSNVAMAAESLLNYCRRENWSGHDPYDALNSRLLRNLGVLKSSLLRLVATQGMKRSPVNLRGLLRVPREQNPKGIAVFLAAAVQLHRVGRGSQSLVFELAARLLELRSTGQPHSCWGYNFDWQTRTYLVPRGTR